MGAFGQNRSSGLDPASGDTRRRQGGTLAFLLMVGVQTAFHAAPALASPGANRCDLATATVVTPGQTGQPATFTLSGNNSSPGVCSGSAGACALDAECPPSETCDGDCVSSFDRGYWEAFTLTADARVTIHFCNTAPVRQGGDYVYVDTTCEAGTGACGDATRADSAARADVCLSNVGPYCPDVDCSAGNNNISMTFNTLPGGVTYYLPIASANNCERTDPFSQASIQCETDADCPVDRPCVSGRGPYSIRVLAEELPTAACCHPDVSCDERNILSCEGIGGTYLGPPNRSPIIPLCVGDPCATGSCCTGETGCKDSRETAGHVPMTKAICEAGPFNGSYVGGIFCKGGTCVGGADAGLSCTTSADCAQPGGVCTADSDPARANQPNPCRLCTVDPGYCHEPGSGFARFVSDLNRNARTADDFIAEGSPITTVCWWGYYHDDVGTNGNDCGPGPGDAFTVTVYTDAGGLPGAPIVSQAVLSTVLQANFDSPFKRYEYSATLPVPVAVTPGLKHWIEIVNNTTTPPAACNWAWKQSNGGNNYSVMSMGDGYSPEDVFHGLGDADAAFCLNTSIGPDDGGAVLGACCTCPSSCADARTRAQCNGVWHLGQTCAAVSCAPPNVDVCTAAQPLLSPSTPFHNTCANRDGPATVPTDGSPTTNVDRDVWQTYYAASTNPTVTFSACDVSFDAVIAVYSNGTRVCSCPMDNSTLIAANDEGCVGAPFVGGGGKVTIPVTAGNCYLVRIAGYNGNREMGLGRIDVSQAGVPPPTIYVNAAATGLNNGTTWANAFTKLQEALAVPAAIGTEIWVAKGTYKPATCAPPCNGSSPQRSATFQLKSGMGLYGGFRADESSRGLRDPTNNPTILSGDLNGDDVLVPCTANSPDCDSFGGLCVANSCITSDNHAENCYHVVKGSPTDITAILDGFTVTGANGNGTNPMNVGGGMYNDSPGGSPTVTNCIFTGNSVNLNGGGMFNIDGSSPMVTNCTFRGNSSNGDGGGMYNNSGSPTVTNCTFSGNRANGGGAILNDGASSRITNCTFSGNSAGSGGAMFNSDAPSATVTNCAFSGNRASGAGGGMYNNGSSPTVTNCTFSGNAAIVSGGGIYNINGIPDSNPTVTNCILSGNSDVSGMGESGQIHTDSGTPTVNYSIVEGGWSGAGSNNLSSDPMFVNPGADDLRLQSGSPAIDAGDNTATGLSGVTMDLDGNPRFVEDRLTANTGNGTPPIVDMGAYEFARDCNNNGTADDRDLVLLISKDCNANFTPDSCDIAGCGGGPACADCNLDDVPDGCQVPSSPGCPGGGCVSGCLADVDQNCVPDVCVAPTGAGGTPNWDDGTNWTLAGSYPDNLAGVADLHVTLNHTLTLNVPVVIDSLLVLNGVALEVTGGDLTITGAAVQTAGITLPPRLRLSGSILLAFNRAVCVGTLDGSTCVPSSAMAIDSGGVLAEQPSAGATSASVAATDVTIESAACHSGMAGGVLELTDSMRLDAIGAILVNGLDPSCPHSCSPIPDAVADVSGITLPPRLYVRGQALAQAFGPMSISGAADVLVDSTEPVELKGDFDNQSVVPSLFDWTTGRLTLSGVSPQTFEVAGINLGQTMGGFSTNADALFDNCPPAQHHTNFSIGTLEAASGAHVTFVNRSANTVGVGCGEALYVSNLTLRSGSTITIDNCKVYYASLTNEGVTPTFIGCGELLSITPTPPPQAPPGDPHVNRSLELLMPPLSTAASGGATALRVALVELQNPQPLNPPCCPPQDFSSYEFAPTCTDPGGCARWVGEPRPYLESQGNPGSGSFKAARLQCTPYYHDWTTDGLFYVVGAEVIPSSTYHVQQFATSCLGAESTCTAVSAPMQIKTGRHGDIAARFNPPDPSTQPDAIDLTQLVNTFKNVVGAPSKAIAQIQPNVPELNADINALDIVAVVDAIKGKAYPFSGPCPCPSLATCNSTPCATPAVCVALPALSGGGPGAMCVKTCQAPATNAGEPCISNVHCPGGTCGSGHCRDKCGRCTP